jgi:hypothetical protein
MKKEKALKKQRAEDLDIKRMKAISQLTDNSVDAFPSRQGVRSFLFEDPKQLSMIKQAPVIDEQSTGEERQVASKQFGNGLSGLINVFKSSPSKDKDVKKKKKAKKVDALNNNETSTAIEDLRDPDGSDGLGGDKPVKVKVKKSKKAVAVSSDVSETRETTDGECGEKHKKKGKKVTVKNREFKVEQQNPENNFVEKLTF